MFVLFDDAGKFLTGRILSETDASLQVELSSGKRLKVKAAHALLRFAKPEPDALMTEAQALANDLDLDLAWSCAPDDEFGYVDLARDYFGDQATTAQQVAALLRLTEAPHYFRRAGKGRYRKAAADVLQQALAAIEKKQKVQAQIDTWAAELAAGACPDAVRQQLYRLLFKPDKNAPEYKAVVHAARSTQLSPLALLQRAGALGSPYQFHWQRFLYEHFPKGTGFPALAPPIEGDLPLAEVSAFSIDDSSTTEIDDALSVQGLGSGTVTLGIHIAAPGLAVLPDSPVDEVARNRLSTVYMPGHKITMLPDAVVQEYTLEAGAPRPALSLYVQVREEDLAVLESRTVIERVPIAHNLRHDALDGWITADWLTRPDTATAADFPAEAARLRPELAFLYRFALACKARREAVRGKPETFTRPDYTFKLVGVQGPEPDGTETVVIGTRSRGAPLDLIVAEAMIVANSTWGQWLASLGVPAIYRSQASLAPGVKVRMGAKALPHAGLGVPSYAWSTSPLRRYTDLVNQWQIVACVRHGAAAGLVAPFKPRDAGLFAIISAFDAAYTAYNQFQTAIERYWTLRHLEQAGLHTLTATVIKDQLVRADDWPLVMPVMGADGLPRGARVRVKLGQADLMTLEIGGTVIERLDAAGAAAAAPDDADEDVDLAPPVALAIALDEDTPDGADASPPTPASP